MKTYHVNFSFNGKNYKGDINAASPGEAETKLRKKIKILSIKELSQDDSIDKLKGILDKAIAGLKLMNEAKQDLKEYK